MLSFASILASRGEILGTSQLELTQSLIGLSVIKALSSLRIFVLYFEDGRALVLDAVDAADALGPDIDCRVLPSAEVEAPDEAVCAVDWSWIYGKTLNSVERGSGGYGPAIRLNLAGTTVTTSVGLWEGKAFLSFMPYKDPQGRR